MTDGEQRQLATWLEAPDVREIDPDAVARLHEAARGAGPRGAELVRLPHGTTVGIVVVGGAARRVLEIDGHGMLLTGLRWRSDGSLAAAWVRCPDRSWLRLEPAATTEAPWGLSDRLWHVPARSPVNAGAGEALTVLEAMDWSGIDRIPTLLEPARVPPGGGTAVLNLIATLARDQARSRLAYGGPYPGEQLFLALLESFRYVAPPGAADPLAAFMHGGLDWAPAPHERAFPADGLCVQLREGIEKVTWKGRTYYRPVWQGLERHAPRRLLDDGDGVRCVLWALGALIEDHLRLSPAGEIAEVCRAELPEPTTAADLPGAVAPGVADIVAAGSAPPLAPFIRAEGARLRLEWAPTPGDLVRLADDRVRLSVRLRDVVARRLAAAGSLEARAAVALTVLTEMAQLLGDALRARAQAHVAALPPEAQARWLGSPDRADDPGAPRRIVLAVQALLAPS